MSSLRNLVFVLLFLWVGLSACQSTRGQADPPSTPSPATTAAASARNLDLPFSGRVLEPGRGEAMQEGGAVQVEILVWEDQFHGKPLGSGRSETVIPTVSERYPNLALALKGVKEGEKRRFQMTLEEYVTRVPKAFKASQPVFLETRAIKVFPPDKLEVTTVRPGSGERTLKDGDLARVHYSGWLDKFDGEKVFVTTKDGAPYTFEMGKRQVVEGLEVGLRGMKTKEVRRLAIPHFLGFGEAKNEREVPAYNDLFYEVELLEFVEPKVGEVEIEIVKPGSGKPPEIGEQIWVRFKVFTGGFGERLVGDSKDEPSSFPVGQAGKLSGWKDALVGMKMGERRRVIMPYNKAYGSEGNMPDISGYETLYYEFERVPEPKE